MLDTNIFNRVLNGEAQVSDFGGKAHFYATHVQFDELKKTSNSLRREQLIAVFEEVVESNVPTESAVWDVSAWDQAKWGGEVDIYSSIKAELDKRNKNKRKNNIEDALIAETAIKNMFVLVTEDRDLRAVATELGGNCISLGEMIKELGG